MKKLLMTLLTKVMMLSAKLMNRVDPILYLDDKDIIEIEEIEENKQEDSGGIISISEFSREVVIYTDEYLKAVQAGDKITILKFAQLITCLSETADMINHFDEYELN